jgi:pSer/pThr/pTyr-binding forkhead associated (FHA) protein
MNGIPATPTSVPAMPARVPPPIASILVRSGPQKGERLTVRTPVANIGRADYNDLVVPDASVSTMHAKLVRREGLWMIADLGSTNGSWVDEERVEDELPLTPGATIRLGEVTMMFEPLDSPEPADPVGSRVTDRFERPDPEPIADAPPPARRAVANGSSRRQTSAPPETNRLPVLLLAGLIVIALGLVLFVMN